MVSKKTLIQNPQQLKPHVVLLGAGASRAAFPSGEASSKKLPLMNDFIETLKLNTLLNGSGIGSNQNIETIYPTIQDTNLKTKLDKNIHTYFLSLSMPNNVTDYDRLVLSLREKDAIFTFNWDPFLFDAWARNREIAKLPEIFFLHGNVRIGFCSKDNKFGRRLHACPDCNKQFSDVPLLYPITQKDYSATANKYIEEAWKSANDFFKNAFTITIFGYGAPTSDTEAIKLLQSAWFEGSPRKLEHIEIIDIADSDTLHNRWSSFTPTNHYRIHKSFDESRIYKWPRRTCESLIYPMRDGIACEAFPLTSTNDLVELQNAIKEIAHYENCVSKNMTD